MDKIPPEILRRIPPLLDHSDVSHLMRAGSRRLYCISGEYLYANIHFNLPASEIGPQHTPHSGRRYHGRAMLELLSDVGPRGTLEHPALWVRHISFTWPMFPSDIYTETCSLLVKLLSLAFFLRSLELRGPSPPAWPGLLSDAGSSPQFAPRLVAVKSNDVVDITSLATGRRLESIYIPSWLSQQQHHVLMCAISHSSAAMAQLQLWLKADNIQDILTAFRALSAHFPKLSVLCVQFDLGLGWTERPLSWNTLNAALAHMGAALREQHHLHTVSVTIFPEPMPNLGENKRAIQVLGQQCDTLRHIEVRWMRRDGDGYQEVSFGKGLLRGQWVYAHSLAT